jgi:hypothetical protein
MRFTALEFFGDNIFKDDFFTNFEYKKGTAGLLCNVPRCKQMLVLDAQDTVESAMKSFSQQVYLFYNLFTIFKEPQSFGTS